MFRDMLLSFIVTHVIDIDSGFHFRLRPVNKAIIKAQEVASQTLFLDNQGNTPMAFHNEPFDRHGSSQYVEAEQIVKLVQSRIVHTRPLQSINSYSRPTSSPTVVQGHEGQCLQMECKHIRNLARNNRNEEV